MVEEPPCHPQAGCFNTIGGVECVCSEGRIGNGVTTCEELEEEDTTVTAAPPAGFCMIGTDCKGSNMQSVETECSCRPGYAQVGPNCQDEVHCDVGGLNNDCHRRATCQEESGFPGFSCSCVDGWTDAFEGANGKACKIVPPTATDPPPDPLTQTPSRPAGVRPFPNRPTVFPPKPGCLFGSLRHVFGWWRLLLRILYVGPSPSKLHLATDIRHKF